MFTEMKTETFNPHGQGLERLDNRMEIRMPENSANRAEVTEDMLMERLHTAEQAVGKFFNLPEVPMDKGDSISVELHNLETATDDRLLYNLDQFKSMGCLSFADMTKILAHEFGHRMLQNEGIGQWAGELGADYFSGALSEMLGLPSSNVEPVLGRQDPSMSHPGGDLRSEAIAYGHEVVNDMMRQGINPTIEDCLEKFLESPYSRIEDPDRMDSSESMYEKEERTMMDNTENHKEYVDPEYREREARGHKDKADWEERFSREALNRGDFKSAREHAEKAKEERKKAKEWEKEAERDRRILEERKRENGYSR